MSNKTWLCVECHQAIPLPTSDPMRCPTCRKPPLPPDADGPAKAQNLDMGKSVLPISMYEAEGIARGIQAMKEGRIKSLEQINAEADADGPAQGQGEIVIIDGPGSKLHRAIVEKEREPKAAAEPSAGDGHGNKLARFPYRPTHASPYARALAAFYRRAIIPADHPTACWGWSGAVSEKRGGARRPALYLGNGRSQQCTLHAARFILCIVTRKSIRDPYVLTHEAGHTCHNETCVNPRHLRWVTRSENEQDKHR